MPFKALVGKSGFRLFDYLPSQDLRGFAQEVTAKVDELRQAYKDYHSQMVSVCQNLDVELHMAYQHNAGGNVEWPPLVIE